MTATTQWTSLSTALPIVIRRWRHAGLTRYDVARRVPPPMTSPAAFRRQRHDGLIRHGVATRHPPHCPWPLGAITVIEAVASLTSRSSTSFKRRTVATVPKLPVVTAKWIVWRGRYCQERKRSGAGQGQGCHALPQLRWARIALSAAASIVIALALLEIREGTT